MPTKKEEKQAGAQPTMSIPLLGGSGVGPVGNRPREAKPEKEPEVPAEKAKAAVGDTQNPALSYQERLRKAGITEEHARRVVDTVLIGEQYLHEVDLTPNLTVVFTTRVYKDTQRVSRVLEAEAPTFDMHVNDLIARYNLAASLHQYGSTRFSPRNPDDDEKDVEAFDERLRFIMRLPEVAVRRLFDELNKFDREINVIFSEGVVQDF